MSAALTLNREVQVRSRITSMCVPAHPARSFLVPRRRGLPAPSDPAVPLRPPVPHSFNRRQVDFNALKDYNDYLETVEDIIFNLCEGVDVRATEARVEAYRRENAAEIARLNQRNAEEDSRRRALAGAPAASHARDADAAGDPWAPRRMSNASDAEKPPDPPRPAPASAASSDTPIAATSGAGAPVLPVPAAVPVPLSAGKMLEGGHGRHAHHGGWDDAGDRSEEGHARREAAIASACGVDFAALGAARARQEAFQSLFCFLVSRRGATSVRKVGVGSCRGRRRRGGRRSGSPVPGACTRLRG